jgi:cell division protease FtsH
MGEEFKGDREKGNNPLWMDNTSRAGCTRWLLPAILLFMLMPLFLNMFRSEPAQSMSYTEFKEQIRSGNVAEILVTGQRVNGKYQEPVVQENAQGVSTEVKEFVTFLPPFEDQALLPMLEDANVLVRTQPESEFSVLSVMFALLPLVILIGFGYLIFKRMRTQGGGENIMSMTRSRAKQYQANAERTTFKDVAGSDEAKLELEEIVQFLRDPTRFQKLGAKIPKGVLLVGPPGTGKTLLARAVAGEAGVQFFSISGSDFMEMFVGVGASRVRDLFATAKKNSPAIIFIDELDSIGRKRGAGLGGGHDEREQTLNQLLSEMDGFEKNQNVIVMAATNRPDILDAAILRPGRFDRQVTVDLPTLADRIEILRIHTRDKPISKEINMDSIARSTPGFSGADLANLMNESALLAARRSKEQIDRLDVEDARDKVIMGLKRNMKLNEQESKLIAYHEAGHAVVGAVLPYTDPVHKVTIIPRGRAMGVTQVFPEREQFLYPRDAMLDRMAVMMGGRAAEEISMGTYTSGASNDLKQATNIARKMVLEWGMSNKMGPVSLSDENQAVFLGDEITRSQNFSDATAREADEEIRAVLNEAYARAKDVLIQHREGLERVVGALIDKEQISGDELLVLLNLKNPAKTYLPDFIDNPNTRDTNVGGASSGTPAISPG